MFTVLALIKDALKLLKVSLHQPRPPINPSKPLPQSHASTTRPSGSESGSELKIAQNEQHHSMHSQHADTHHTIICQEIYFTKLYGPLYVNPGLGS